MMGHTGYHGSYQDVMMVGIEYLRLLYKVSGISLKQGPEFDRLLLLKQTIERLDYKPEEVLKPEILEKLS
jgi:hypothetical protein